MERLLVIDDDVDTCRLLATYLEPEGFAVDVVHDGETGLERLNSHAYDLVLLDVLLPQINGFEVLRRLRKNATVPVLMVTSCDDEIDTVVALETGADDYIIKPFRPRELLARIRAVLRRVHIEQRAARTEPSTRLAVGDVEMQLGSRLVYCAGRQIDLTTVEFDILETLLRNAGQTVLRNHLKLAVLGREPDPYDRSLDVHVSRLRKKLGHRVSGTSRIQAIRGAGYLYSMPPEAVSVLSLSSLQRQPTEMIG
jgi:two-component system, OmpR family, response regulator CpxR